MKKIIAAAVATAFVAPAFAADITVSGVGEAIIIDSAGVTSTQIDQNVTIAASTEMANGMTIATDINIGADASTETGIFNEGGNSVTISGAFGKVDIGDTSGAVDAIDDTTETAKELGQGTDGDDATLLWTLPSLAEGLTVMVSMNTDESTVDATTSGLGAAAGAAVKYSASGLTIGYASNQYDTNIEEQIYNVSYSMSGIKVGLETLKNTAADGTEDKQKAYGLSYTSGDLMIGAESQEIVGSDGATDNEYTIYTLQYSLGGGVTAYIETSDDAKTGNSEQTAAGIEFKF